MAVLRLGRGRRALHGARAARGRLAAEHARRRATGSTPAQAAHVGGAGRRRARLRARCAGWSTATSSPRTSSSTSTASSRVADFGLARALGRGELDRAGGCGRRHRPLRRPRAGHRRHPSTGAPTSTRSGLVLVEAVTGSVPLVADTPLGTSACARSRAIAVPATSGRSCRSSRTCAPWIPTPGTPTPTRCATRSPRRPTRLPPPGPLVLAGLGADRRGPAPDPGRAARRAVAAVRPGRAERDAPDSGATRPGQRRPHAGPAVGRADPHGCGPRGRRRRHRASSSRSPPSGRRSRCRCSWARTSPTPRTRPSARGSSLSETYRRADDPKGVVIAQSPRPGRPSSRNGARSTSWCPGARSRSGCPTSSARPSRRRRQLLQAQFAVEVVQQPDEQVAEGSVISSSPSEHAPPDSTVTLTVSSGPPPRHGAAGGRARVPERSQAAEPAPVPRVARRHVRRQRDPRSGRADRSRGWASVPVGSSVTVLREQGPGSRRGPQVQETDHRGRDRGPRRRPASRCSHRASSDPVTRCAPQDPPKGTKVKRGTVVTIFF